MGLYIQQQGENREGTVFSGFCFHLECNYKNYNSKYNFFFVKDSTDLSGETFQLKQLFTGVKPSYSDCSG